MRPVSASFLAAVNESHQMATRVRVCTTVGQTGTNPAGYVIPVVSGAVTYDSTAQVQGSADIVTTQPWPANSSDLITPYGNELYIERGVVYGSGVTEWVGLGYFRIEEPQQQIAPMGTIEMSSNPDRMQTIIDARIPFPIQFNAGMTVHDVIVNIVSGAFNWIPQFTIDASLSTQTLSVAQTTTEDRYQFLSDLVTSYGMIMYWDYKGYFVVKPVPTPVNSLWTVSSGRNGTLVSMARQLLRSGIYNGAVTSSQGGSASVHAVAVDNNPNSPTYWYGKFGQVPQFQSSSFYTSSGQCQTAALALLQKSVGLPYEVDFGMVPNPALELYDPIIVAYNNGVQEHHVIKQMVIGLRATDVMTAQTRQLLSGNFQVIS